MNSSDLRINCVMDGLQISIEYFLNRLENFDLNSFRENFSMSESSSLVNPQISRYNLLGQINLTSVNLFTSQLMMRIDSMASDLNGSKLTCSVNGFAINSMYAPSATLSCLKASELLQHRIVYFSVMRINFSQDVKEVYLSLTEEIFVQWSPLFHINVLELWEDFCRIYNNFRCLRSTPTNRVSYDNFKRFNMHLKLDGKISLGMLLSDQEDTMRFETEYFTVSLLNMRCLSSKCELLCIYFNDVLTCNLEVSDLTCILDYI